MRNVNWVKVVSRAVDHMMGADDHDEPSVPILSMREARISLVLRIFWIILHITTCVVVIASVFRHW